MEFLLNRSLLILLISPSRGITNTSLRGKLHSNLASILPSLLVLKKKLKYTYLLKNLNQEATLSAIRPPAEADAGLFE
ncbi:hypothetical protein COY33_02115 [candidate division WWE3 bacterium CG_4_10_14_0_2_um_filter_42_7]|uniref:Uncharacterized protein n=2 Tax=Katanobacteria TaxID=422282 RepID=A0A2H0X9J0_UNCKA|nr:MAG: hypothetical protein COT51_01995 [candidate division WWE3 bacterium CG08_land_8_20_14_0_20_41_15]PIZ43106.1 MAG: hypothetical protein COY33_02115 [candidate division WWE3 bacterium CG_4_10_14_0_2_um_filter_42_7]